MSPEFRLPRDAEESERLIKQHDLYIRNLGYQIHPWVAKGLSGSDVRVADIGCGTAIWLIDLALTTNNPRWHFDGFDISDEQFPHLNKHAGAATADAMRAANLSRAETKDTSLEGENIFILPENMNLHVHDVLKPFPQQFHGKYDIVHTRLLVLGLDPREFEVVVDNLKSLLKPGGWMQWEEADAAPLWSVLRSGDSPIESGLPFLNKCVHHAMQPNRDRLDDVHNTLLRAFQKGGLKHVQDDVVSMDRIPELRTAFMQVEISILKNIIKKRIQDNVEKDWTEEELERNVKGMQKEVQQGAYIVYHIHSVVGQHA